jgi:hypothetical protein
MSQATQTHVLEGHYISASGQCYKTAVPGMTPGTMRKKEWPVVEMVRGTGVSLCLNVLLPNADNGYQTQSHFQTWVTNGNKQ